MSEQNGTTPPWAKGEQKVTLTKDQAMKTREGLLLQVDALEQSMGVMPLTSELRQCFYFNKVEWGADLVVFRKTRAAKKRQANRPTKRPNNNTR